VGEALSVELGDALIVTVDVAVSVELGDRVAESVADPVRVGDAGESVGLGDALWVAL
jgi:hypothetical protein